MSELNTLDKIILFIKSDLDGCLCGGVNISMALLLSAYSEFFGHLLTGCTNNRLSYDEWLRYMGLPYSDLINQKINLYDRVRCGLVHEYAIKKGARIFTEEGCPGIELKNNVIYFNNLQYKRDFILSIERYYTEIQKSNERMNNFKHFIKLKDIVVI